MSRIIDITGQKFHKLTVLKCSYIKDKRAFWLCRCDCGCEKDIRGDHLKSGRIKSCGCLQSPSILERLDKYIDKSSDRWMWIGCIRGKYGQIWYKGKFISVHRLVYELFVGPISEGMFVCHKNDIPLDVTPSNLFLGTPRDNMRDMIEKGRKVIVRGDKSGASKLKSDEVREIRILYQTEKYSYRTLGRMFGVTKATIQKIITNQTWRHVRC